jgi:hypothetical protein
MQVSDFLLPALILFGALVLWCVLVVRDAVGEFRRATLLMQTVKESAEKELKALSERPASVEAREILHDLSAHGKSVVIVQRIGMDEILLRPRGV